tara:strand:+ start:7326 stop:8039 length:714 start_codon:yes stop_codon:yes gene_type:complete
MPSLHSMMEFYEQDVNIEWSGIIWENLDHIDNNKLLINDKIHQNNTKDEYKDNWTSIEQYSYPNISLINENIIFLDRNVFDYQIENMYPNLNAAEKQFIIDMHRSELYINGNCCKKRNPIGVINYLESLDGSDIYNKKLITCLTQSIMSIPVFFIHSCLYNINDTSEMFIGELDSYDNINKSMQIFLDTSSNINLKILKNMRIFNTLGTICSINIKIDFDLIDFVNNPIIVVITPIK